MAITNALSERVTLDIFERLYPRTQELLKNTKEPKHAYVCLEVPKRRVSHGSNPVMTTGICLINVEDQPGQKYILDDLINNRNSRIVCYGNFPAHNDDNPGRARMYQHHNEPSGINPWESLAQYCKSQLGQIESIASEVRKYKEELEAAKKELAEARGETNERQATKGSNAAAVGSDQPGIGANAGAQAAGNTVKPGLPKTESPGRGRQNA